MHKSCAKTFGTAFGAPAIGTALVHLPLYIPLTYQNKHSSPAHPPPCLLLLQESSKRSRKNVPVLPTDVSSMHTHLLPLIIAFRRGPLSLQTSWPATPSTGSCSHTPPPLSHLVPSYVHSLPWDGCWVSTIDLSSTAVARHLYASACTNCLTSHYNAHKSSQKEAGWSYWL